MPLDRQYEDPPEYPPEEPSIGEDIPDPSVELNSAYGLDMESWTMAGNVDLDTLRRHLSRMERNLRGDGRIESRAMSAFIGCINRWLVVLSRAVANYRRNREEIIVHFRMQVNNLEGRIRSLEVARRDIAQINASVNAENARLRTRLQNVERQITRLTDHRSSLRLAVRTMAHLANHIRASGVPPTERDVIALERILEVASECLELTRLSVADDAGTLIPQDLISAMGTPRVQRNRLSTTAERSFREIPGTLRNPTFTTADTVRNIEWQNAVSSVSGTISLSSDADVPTGEESS